MRLLVKKLKMKEKVRTRERAKKLPATTTKKAIASRTISKMNTANKSRVNSSHMAKNNNKTTVRSSQTKTKRASRSRKAKMANKKTMERSSRITVKSSKNNIETTINKSSHWALPKGAKCNCFSLFRTCCIGQTIYNTFKFHAPGVLGFWGFGVLGQGQGQGQG